MMDLKSDTAYTANTANSTYNGNDNSSHTSDHHYEDGHIESHVWKGCAWQSMFGKSLNEVSLYLYPCVVEYSLICAGVYPCFRVQLDFSRLASFYGFSMKQCME